MAVNRTVVDATPEQVFEVLSDPRSYGYFVVGTRKVRRFHPRWPEPGSDFHHSLGVGMTLIRDRTVSVECEPPRLLVLHARMMPVGIQQTVFRLAPTAEGTLIEVEETPIGGVAAVEGLRPVVDRMLWARNELTLRRIRELVRRHTEVRARQGDEPAG